jgi:hypothetical protein
MHTTQKRWHFKKQKGSRGKRNRGDDIFLNTAIYVRRDTIKNTKIVKEFKKVT